MDEFGIPSGKIYRTPEMLEDAHFRARQAIVTTLHPRFGELKMQNVAPKLSATPGGIRSPATELGQHNDEIYGGLLSLDEEQRAGLRSRGII
jgi:formyl-CoA transferase